MGGSEESSARGEVAGSRGTDGKFRSKSDSTGNLERTVISESCTEKKRSPIKKFFGLDKNKSPKVNGVGPLNVRSSKGNTNIPQAQKVTIMTIEEIRPRLETAIERKGVHSIIGIIKNRHETINEAINTGNTEIMDLVIEAANVRAVAKGKTAYNIAKNKKNQEFLDTVDSAREKLAQIEEQQRSKSIPEEIDEVCKEQQANFVQSHSALPIDTDYTGELNFNVDYCLIQPELAINGENIHDILDTITESIELIHSILNSNDQTNKQLLIDNLHKAIKVTDSDGNTIFHLLASREPMTKDTEKTLELLMNLEGFMQVAMEAKNKEGKTPLDVAEESGNSKFILNIKRVRLTKLSAFESDSDPQATKSSKPNLEQTTSSSDSESDSGIDSPEPSGKGSELNGTEDSESPKSSRSGSLISATSISSNGNLSSSTENLNSVLNTTAETSSAQIKPKTPPKPFPRQSKQPTLNPELTPDPDSESDSGRGSDEETPKQFQVEEPQKEKSDKLEKQKLLIDGNNNNCGNKDTTLTKQSNNRNFYIALTVVCTLGAIACFAAAADLYFMSAKKTELAASSIAVIGALCVIGIGFTIAAVTTWRLTPSSEVESMSVHTLANGKQR